jgi:16S rRNA (guanine(1405)-N(7))-methyltransferase
MSNNYDIEGITSKVLRSKKYRSLYRPTVERIVKDAFRRYPEKEVEKAVKRKLHQIWGAYFTRPNFDKLFEKVKEEIEKGEDIQAVLSPILMLQTSTKERIPVLDNFYQRIFSITGQPKTIVEPGCGINALTYFWMDSPIKYIGYDVDRELIAFLNSIFKLLSVKKQAQVKLGDVLVDEVEQADVGLLLKVLPLLEHQRQGCSIEILKRLRCKHIVVSYPTRSISGKQKGMVDFYTKYFQDLVKNEPWKVDQIPFDTELVFVVRK